MMGRRWTGLAGWTRLLAVGAAALTVVVGLAVRATMSGVVAKYAGDALYTVLVYALVVLVAPRARPLVVAGVAALVSWAVEFLQLTDLPAWLSGRSALARLVLGSTFNPPDLLWYVVGAAAACLLHAAVRHRSGRPDQSSGGSARSL